MIVVIAFTSAIKIILSPAGIRNGESPWRKAAGGSKISYLSCVSVEGFVWWWKSLSYRVLLATFLVFTLLSLSDCLSQDIGLLLWSQTDWNVYHWLLCPWLVPAERGPLTFHGCVSQPLILYMCIYICTKCICMCIGIHVCIDISIYTYVCI